MRAFLYLVWTSGRNRLVSRLRRVQSPRYAAALIVGALYIWMFLLRPTTRDGLASGFLAQSTEMVVTLLTVLTLMGSWVFGSDITALAFSQAEVSLLFPAPLARRALIGYKLFRAQIAVIINVLIWVFVLRRGGTLLPSALRAVGLWVLFSTLNLHRLGAALVRASWREHGIAGARRQGWSIVVFAAVGAGVLAGLGAHRGALLAAGGIGEFFTALGRALAEPPASIALAPFHLVVAPTFARSVGQWSTEIGPALAMLAVHAWWVFRTDAAFEDAALEASAERARRIEAMRARRSVAATGAPRAATSTIRLAAGGSPAGAILWKNMLCLKRTAQLRVFVGPVAMSIVIGVATAGGGGGAGPGEVLAVSALALTAMLLIFGGRLIRNDLRHDMQHLPLIKSLPLAPADIVLAEVASAALPMAVGQLVLVVVAYLAISLSGSNPLAANSTFGLLLAAPFALLALNGALLTIQNGTAVLFPGWVRLGPVVSTGVEALGQNLLATVANLLSLAIALIVPALIAWTALSVMRDPHGAAIAAVVVVGAGVLAAETYGAIRFLGNALARAEPAQTA